MARELDAILDHGEATHAASCVNGESGAVSYLEEIICPIYETVARVSAFPFSSVGISFDGLCMKNLTSDY